MKENLAILIIYAANIYMVLIVARSFFGWVRQALIFKNYWFFGTVMKVVDPFLTIVRRFIPASYNQWDFAPVVGVILVEVIKDLLLFVIKLAAK
jgi:uncharacterized protein YggT (Ycf19 family)